MDEHQYDLFSPVHTFCFVAWRRSNGGTHALLMAVSLLNLKGGNKAFSALSAFLFRLGIPCCEIDHGGGATYASISSCVAQAERWWVGVDWHMMGWSFSFKWLICFDITVKGTHQGSGDSS